MMNLEQRNKQLEEKLKDSDLPKAVTILIKDAKKRKRNEKILAVSVILDILLTIGFGFITIRTHRLAVQAETNRNSIVRTCQSSNEARANNKLLWDHIIDITNKPPASPEETKGRIDFKAFIDKTFEQRDCSKL